MARLKWFVMVTVCLFIPGAWQIRNRHIFFYLNLKGFSVKKIKKIQLTNKTVYKLPFKVSQIDIISLDKPSDPILRQSYILQT